MDPRLTRRIAQYVGIAAAVTVPALVVAQQMINPPSTNFAAGELLRASDIDQLRDALVEAIGRLNALAGRTSTLEARPRNALTTGGVGTAIANPDFAESAVSPPCGAGTIAVSCNCASSTTFARFMATALDSTSGTCSCRYFNPDATRTTTITASANCIPR